MTYPIKSPRKLIEVALPLDDINAAAAREKSIRHGHPSTLHLWWARRPLAAARAVLFAQMVNDPGYQQGGGFKYGMNKEAAAKERERLFDIIRDLVKWENTNNEEVLEQARAEIRRSWREVCELNKDHPQAAELFNPDVLPAFHDPFAGGGTIPLEAQRLGLEAYASDLNPVAVLINKAMIEIPPKFASMPPVNPEARAGKNGQGALFGRKWKGAEGLAEDVRYYGRWMRERAQERIGHLYPKVKITEEIAVDRSDLKPLIGQELTIIAWLWVRTVKSPNPAFSHTDVPLASNFFLSTKEGKEVYMEPVRVRDDYSFKVRIGKPIDPATTKSGTKLARGANFICLLSGTPIPSEHIYNEAKHGRIGARLMAVVCEGPRGRLYLSPTAGIEALLPKAYPDWRPDLVMPDNPRWFSPPLYGLKTYGDIFTSRQLVALTTFSDLVTETSEQARVDALAAGLEEDNLGVSAGGRGTTAYGEAIGVYLAFGVDKMADRHSTLTRWDPTPTASGIINTFSRQAIPMTWDYPEGNPFSAASGNFEGGTEWIAKVLETSVPAITGKSASVENASTQTMSRNKVVSTDPPYYANIGYADLSDYFYVWLRRTLRNVFPNLFTTIAVPKAEELIATPYRHESQAQAEAFFLDGMTYAMQRLAEQAHPAFPVTIYYAYKQSESSNAEGTSSTGWETFLEAVIGAGFSLVGTWPMRTELSNRMISVGTNALASSIVLVCRKRSASATTCSRREYVRELNTALPEALDEMTRGLSNGRTPVAPVDLSQAIIGPGMAIFSKYATVLEADGTPMSVRTALQLINRFLAEDDFDADTQFCLHWFDQYGWRAGSFGEADVLARAKGTSVGGVQAAGVVEAGGGSVRLRRWTEYPSDWDPKGDTRNPVWETLHQLIRALKHEGETNAGALLAAVRGKSEATRQLAYRLYTLCERAGWAEDARAYNELITSWDGIEAVAGSATATQTQSGLFD